MKTESVMQAARGKLYATGKLTKGGVNAQPSLDRLHVCGELLVYFRCRSKSTSLRESKELIVLTELFFLPFSAQTW